MKCVWSVINFILYFQTLKLRAETVVCVGCKISKICFAYYILRTICIGWELFQILCIFHKNKFGRKQRLFLQPMQNWEVQYISSKNSVSVGITSVCWSVSLGEYQSRVKIYNYLLCQPDQEIVHIQRQEKHLIKKKKKKKLGQIPQFSKNYLL